MMDLASLSKFDGHTLWAYYRRDVDDFNYQIAMAKRRHGITEADNVTCICRPYQSEGKGE